MKKKIISWLSYMTVLAFLLQSCRHDELTNPENSSPNGSSLAAKYASKSPWKEDEVYIGKVQQVFLKHANLEYVRSRYGELNWNYAMSFGQFGERYALVPVIKNDKVVLLMEAVRKGHKVYFYEKEDPELMNFFNTVIFSAITGFDETINSSSKGLSYLCSTRTVTVGCPDGVPNCTPMNTTSTVCEWVFTPGTPPKGFDPIGDPDAGGGGSGYEYPTPPDDEYLVDPCELTKNKIINPKFKAKFQELNTPEMFAMDHEKGFYERLPPVGSTGISSGFPVVDGAPCTRGLDFPDNENGVAGLMHTHNDEDCNGNLTIKIFSPKDVRTFLNKLMPQANNYTGSYSNAYSVVVTSQGSYMLQYNSNTWPGSTWNKIDDWNNWYKKEYDKLIRDDQFTQANVEKVFTQFLEEKVGIDGLEVYKVTANSSTKLEYNGSNQPVTATPCPQ